MRARTVLIALAALVAGGTAGAQPASTKPVRVLATELLGSPVRSSRVWLTALAPNKRGGWNFITQSHEFKSTTPTEFVVVDLATGESKVVDDPTGSHGTTRIRDQLRAPNGRIFFPESETNLAYYDPVEETVKLLGRVIDHGDDKTIYRMVFGPDGKLYGGTESTSYPTVFQLDPETLKTKIIGHVGKTRLSYSYAYYLAADPPWLYVAVGQNPWELVAININTGVQRVLETRADNGFIQLDTRKEGITATLISGLHTPQQQREIVWCIDGATYPFAGTKPGTAFPFTPRQVTAAAHPIVSAPEIDTSMLDLDAKGVGRVRWRSASTAPWTTVSFQLHNTSPIDIESLVALSNGGVLGSTKQYHGFFRYEPKSNTLVAYGAHGPSRGARVVVDGLVYITGYPNGVLFVYDPSQPWTSTKALSEQTGPSTVNPRRLGNFTATATKYAYFLVPSKNGKLYYLGRRERDGVGSGIGSFDRKSERFTGHHDRLSFFDPRGLLVDDSAGRIVVSGAVHDDPAHPGETPAEAPLIVYDYDLVEKARLTVRPGITDTGELFAGAAKSEVIGMVRGKATTSVYRYDLAAKKLLDWKDLDGVAGAAAQRGADASIWVVIDGVLWRIDAKTLDARVSGRLTEANGEPAAMIWQEPFLYFNVHDELRRTRVTE